MRFSLLTLFLLLFCCKIFGSNSTFTYIHSNPTDKIISLADSLSVLYDAKNKYSIEEILQMPNAAFAKPNANQKATSPIILWSKFQLQNQSPKTWNAYLDFCNHADSVWIYTLIDGQIIDKDFTGKVLHPYDKDLLSPKNYLLVSLDRGEQKTYYVKMRFNKWMKPAHHTHVHLHPSPQTMQILTERYAFHSFFAGIMFLFCLVSVFMFFVFREYIFLYFALLMFSFGLYFPKMNSVMDVFFSSKLLNDFFLHKYLIISSITVSIFLFTTEFIDLKKRWAKYYTFFLIATIVTAINPFFSMFIIEDEFLLMQIINSVILIWTVIAIVPIIHFSLKKDPQARILLLSIGIFFLSGVVRLLGAIRVLPDEGLVRYGIHIGLLVFSGILFYGLFNRITTIRAEKMRFEELDHLKSRFFANISHEFRTPLTLVMGPIRQVEEKLKDTNDKNLLQMAERNAQRLLQLINQLLDLSKLEAGKMELQAEELNFAALMKGITMSFESLAETKNIHLQFVSPQKDLPIFIDKDKVEKIFYNLLSNAFKFTKEGDSILVELREQKKQIEITVKDSGIGISEDRLPHIFNRFFQADSSTIGEQEGTGIGLALVKELVQLHSGNIEVKSKEGMGTTFTIYLPKGKEHLKENEIIVAKTLVKDETNATPNIHPKHLQSLTETATNNVAVSSKKTSKKSSTILIIEDNIDVRAYIRQYLEHSFQILEAVDGQDGIDKALDHLPDLIISDVMMPQKDGYEVCKILKTDQRTSHIPVILLTAKAAQEEKLQGLETGADDYLVKPFDTRELEIRVRNLIELRRQLRKRFSEAPTIEPKAIQTNAVDKAFIEKLCATVETHLGDEQFSAEVLAAAVNMTRGHLNRKLKALTDQTSNKFIRSFRLQKAAEMLQEGKGNVSEIAFETGFGSTAYFVKCFREKYGKTPGTILNE